MEIKRELRAGFSGPSGIGKTYLAKLISKEMGIKFVSGSMSDLLPDTKNLNQVALNECPTHAEEWSLLKARAELFCKASGLCESFITDRTFIDSVAYYIYKLTGKKSDTSQEEMNTRDMRFIRYAMSYLEEAFTHVILIQQNPHTWAVRNIEDNKKRITNWLFQWQISSLMLNVISELPATAGFEVKSLDIEVGDDPIMVNQIYLRIGRLKVLVVDEPDYTKREDIVRNFLKL